MEKEITNVEICMTQDGTRIKVLPLGEIEGRDGRKWTLSREGAQAVVDEIRRNGIDIVIDFEHGSYAGNGRAAGWLKADSFGVLDDGIYAEVNWTSAGRNAVEGKEYRYLSPAFYSDDTGIRTLETVALVNVPNLVMPALNKRAEGQPPANGGDSPDLAALQLELQATKRRIAEMELAQKIREISDMVESAVKEGRLAPAQVAVCTRIGLADKVALAELIRTSVANLNVLRQPAQGPDGGYHVLADRREQLVQSCMKEHQLNYREAMIRVAKEHPELFEIQPA